MYSGGSHCGQQVTITNTANGKTISAKVADEVSLPFRRYPSPTRG